MTSISALPLSVSDDLLYAETALAACGIRLNDTYNKEFWSLLRLIRRRIKVDSGHAYNVFGHFKEEGLLVLLLSFCKANEIV